MNFELDDILNKIESPSDNDLIEPHMKMIHSQLNKRSDVIRKTHNKQVRDKLISSLINDIIELHHIAPYKHEFYKIEYTRGDEGSGKYID